MPQYDLVITGGEVVDGRGTPRRHADIAISGDRIVEVGPGPYAATRMVDATGSIVAPGFIDLHSHADFSVLGHPAAETQLAQGVTTLLTGNCGQSPFPAAYTPEGFGQAVLDVAPAVNLGLQLGHNGLRTAVIGDDDRRPTADELDTMCAMIKTAADRPGVVGFSTGLIYMPGLFADEHELTTLAAAAAQAGLLYSSHIRNESDHLEAAVREAIDTAEHAGARLEISHLKAMGPENWGATERALELIDAARARGVDVAADVYPYTASSTDLSSRLPGWAVDGGRDALVARLRDPNQRDRIATELRGRFGHDIDPDGVVIVDLCGQFERYIGCSLTEIGRDRGTDAAEAALAVLEANGGGAAIVNHAMSEDDVRAVLAHPVVSVASDGWTLTPHGSGLPHPRSFGTFARVLGRYVREEAVLTLEEAIRKMTSLPASRLGVIERGSLTPGKLADVVVFDPGAIEDASTYLEPWQLARGMRTVLVNGRAAVLDGRFTGERAGRLLSKEASR
ncbi:N-acyl-D-amino-acid deacylase family protein [Nocardia sp. CA-135398]|uniref:N-acyl-D-amino-acid deacylase family protein n=1 Tax=Nocardia sp. CA-135398 TaxID=3239977 RepID=UPI003D965E40